MSTNAISTKHGLIWSPTIVSHAMAAGSAVGIGALILARKKGTRQHVMLGRTWCGLMYTAALTSFGITGLNDGKYSWIHLLSAWTVFSVSNGIYRIRKGNVKAHKTYMRSSLIGAGIAGIFAVIRPGRRMNQLFLNE